MTKAGGPFGLAHEGHADFINLPNDLPFTLVETLTANTGKDSLIVNKIPVFHAKVDFGVAADQLKILGTGGLSTPGKQIGSYMWLAVG